jgi:SAM-dependent methyltransferase
MARIDLFASRHPHTIPVRNATMVGLRGETTQGYQIGTTHPQGAAPLAGHATPDIGVVDDNPGIAQRTAYAYSQAGEQYSTYADGCSNALFDFDGIHAYADACVWKRLDGALRDLRETGAHSVAILDAGCGPGTWLRRMVIRARELGFTEITAHGFDIARAQIRRARYLARDLCQIQGVRLDFEVADLTARIPQADGAIDITLCLYSVLSHLPAERMPKIAAEIARVTRGTFITTMRPIGSQPTVFVDSMEKARHFERDPETDQFEVELSDGRHMVLGAHLFSAAELRLLFTRHFTIEELCGLDLFHSRFAPDSRWNPASLVVDDLLAEHLARLEESFATNPAFLERATHLLLVGRRRAAPDQG